MIANNVLKDLVSVLGRNLPRVEKARAIAQGIRKAGSYRWTGLYDVDNQNGLPDVHRLPLPPGRWFSSCLEWGKVMSLKIFATSQRSRWSSEELRDAKLASFVSAVVAALSSNSSRRKLRRSLRILLVRLR